MTWFQGFISFFFIRIKTFYTNLYCKNKLLPHGGRINESPVGQSIIITDNALITQMAVPSLKNTLSPVSLFCFIVLFLVCLSRVFLVLIWFFAYQFSFCSFCCISISYRKTFPIHSWSRLNWQACSYFQFTRRQVTDKS